MLVVGEEEEELFVGATPIPFTVAVLGRLFTPVPFSFNTVLRAFIIGVDGLVPPVKNILSASDVEFPFNLALVLSAAVAALTGLA
jgi:hypothetical protein